MPQLFSNLSNDTTTPCGLTGLQLNNFLISALTAPTGNRKKPLFTASDLEDRPVYIHPTKEQVATMPANAIIVVADYPFGRHKCVHVSFVEWKDKHGYRRVSATSDKEHTKFNAPKAGTYTMGVASLCWETEENNKEHAGFNIHPLNMYDIRFSTKADSVQAYKKKAEALLKLNLTAHDAEFVNYYLQVCEKRLESLTQTV